MLYGCDISNWNTLTTQMMEKTDFIIHKATEGRYYVDKFMHDHMLKWHKYCQDKGKPCLIGYYHFAKPQHGISVSQSLNNFMTNVPLPKHSALVTLDIEAGAENYPDWCYQWCKGYYEETGVRPLIYTSQSNVKRFEKCYDMDCGLWVAQYKAYGNRFPAIKPDIIKPWPFFAIWQWSNGKYKTDYNKPYVPGTVDQDIFNGSVETWMKYAKGDNA